MKQKIFHLGNLHKVLAVMVVLAILLTALSTTVFAWWYAEWRVESKSDPYCTVGCGLPAGTKQVYQDITKRKWMCHDGSGYCYPTSETKTQKKFLGCGFCN